MNEVDKQEIIQRWMKFMTSLERTDPLIELADISHWNRINDWGLFSKKFKGVIIKATQGASYQDPAFLDHVSHAKAAGMPWGALHFLEESPVLPQVANFKATLGDLKPPLLLAIDAEAYTPAGIKNHYFQSVYNPESRDIVTKGEVFPVLEFRQYDEGYSSTMQVERLYEGKYGLTYPTATTLDAFGRYISGYLGFSYPFIYSNPSTFYKMNCPASMARYFNWLAHWGVPKPTVVKPWVKWDMWQRAVVDGTPYGVVGQIDMDVWNPDNYWPFSPPNPTPTDEIGVTISFVGETNQYKANIKGEPK